MKIPIKISIKSPTLKKTVIYSALTIMLGFLSFYLYTLYKQEIHVLPVNVGAQSFSIAWTTSSPTKGCIIVIPDSQPFKTRVICQQSTRSYTHLVEILPATPDTSYSIWHINELRISRSNPKTVKTHPISETQPPLPDPSYGMVINLDRDRVEGALVILTPQTETFNYPLAAITNKRGTFTLDLNGFSEKPAGYNLEATSDGQIWNDLNISADVVTPMPPITVFNYVQ